MQKWLQEEYPQIHQQSKKEDAEIFWGDETAVQNVANYARGYSPKLQANTEKFTGSLSQDEEHVKSFFDHPSVAAYKLD